MKFLASLMSHGLLLTTNGRIPSDYLSSSDIIDHQDANIRALARALRTAPGDGDDALDEAGTIRRTFEHIRDEIRHSSDHRVGPVTLKAS